MEEVKKSVFDSLKTFLPVNLNVWIIVLTCLVVIIALSRLMTLQKTVSDLASRPAVDEHVVRGIVRQHLEETVKAMDQQNRLQIQMRQQQMEQARRAQPPPPPPPTIEVIEAHPVFERVPDKPSPPVAPPAVEPPPASVAVPLPAPTLAPAPVAVPTPVPATVPAPVVHEEEDDHKDGEEKPKSRKKRSLHTSN